MKKELKNYSHDFTEEEIAGFNKDVTEATLDIEDLESEKAQAAQDIKDKRGLIKEFTTKIRNGCEIRSKQFNRVVDEDMQVIRYQDPKTKEFYPELEQPIDGVQKDLEDDIGNPMAGDDDEGGEDEDGVGAAGVDEDGNVVAMGEIAE